MPVSPFSTTVWEAQSDQISAKVQATGTSYKKRTGAILKLFAYTKYRSSEERLWLAAFWIGILLFILWCEIVIGIAVARLFLNHH